MGTQREMESQIRLEIFAASLKRINFTVEFEDDGTCIVSDNISVVYGEGETRADAFQDYFASMAEYMGIVRDSEKKRQEKFANGLETARRRAHQIDPLLLRQLTDAELFRLGLERSGKGFKRIGMSQ